MSMKINRSDELTEVTAAFARYEDAKAGSSWISP